MKRFALLIAVAVLVGIIGCGKDSTNGPAGPSIDLLQGWTPSPNPIAKSA